MSLIKVRIKLPEEVTVNIPSFSDVEFDDVADAIANHGVKLMKETIERRVIDRFIQEHEPYIQKEVERLVEEKRDEFKKLLMS